MWEISAADVLEQKRPIIFKIPFSSALIAIKDLHLSVSKNMMNSIEQLPKKTWKSEKNDSLHDVKSGLSYII